jgi:hypothetical protein
VKKSTKTRKERKVFNPFEWFRRRKQAKQDAQYRENMAKQAVRHEARRGELREFLKNHPDNKPVIKQASKPYVLSEQNAVRRMREETEQASPMPTPVLWPYPVGGVGVGPTETSETQPQESSTYTGGGGVFSGGGASGDWSPSESASSSSSESSSGGDSGGSSGGDSGGSSGGGDSGGGGGGGGD